MLYVIGSGGRDINAYNLSTPFDISSGEFDQIVLSVFSQDFSPREILFNDDGTVLYMLGGAGFDINAYNLSVAYDISSALFDEIALSVLDEEDTLSDMIFNNDGTVLYVMGADGDDINAYTLSTPYDISSGIFDEIALSVADQENTPQSLLFNDDGTVLYVMGADGDDINAYTLSTPYDISSGMFDAIVLSVGTEDTLPTDMIFNNDGTVLYVLGGSGDDINAYTLSTPYDISSGMFDEIVLSVATEENQAVSMLFSSVAITPTLTTSAASQVTHNSATLNAEITDDGGASITQHGFAFGTNSSLSGGDTATSTLGVGTVDTFDEQESSLTPETTYYFRAYATNSEGTSYGSILNFTTDPTYSVGGTISSLNGTLTLQNNGGDDLTTSSNGSFTFDTELPEGEDYEVTVLTQPNTQTCTVTNGTGTIASSNITNVIVTCADDPESQASTARQSSIYQRIQNLIRNGDIEGARTLIRQQIAMLMSQLISILEQEIASLSVR